MGKQIVGYDFDTDFILCPNTMQASQMRDDILYFINKQPDSFYHTQLDIDDIMRQVCAGLLIPWFYVENNIPIAMALMSFQQYKLGVQSIKIEFLSCDKFFKIAKMFDFLEARALDFGVAFIEAIAHPSIAHYAVKKKGFSAPSQYIVKSLTRERKH